MNHPSDNSLDRREFIGVAAGAMAAAFAQTLDARAAEPQPAAARNTALIDTNVSLGRWPFRRLPL